MTRSHDVIIRQGDESNDFFLIPEGHVHVYMNQMVKHNKIIQ